MGKIIQKLQKAYKQGGGHRKRSKRAVHVTSAAQQLQCHSIDVWCPAAFPLN